ncbi:component of the polarisome, partial [Physocladia obscura]
MGDEIAHSQFVTLARFLGFSPQTLAQNANNANNPNLAASRQNAKDKMMRLSKQQFMDLSTDVTDEINRRAVASPEVPFLPLSELYQPKRNQARQKLATLPLAKFKELATDIFFDLERRFPQAAEIYTGVGQQSQQQATSPRSADSRPHTPIVVGRNVEGISPETVERLRSEYESRIEALQVRMVQLDKDSRTAREEQQRSYENLISEQAAKLQDLELANAQLRDENVKLSSKFTALQEDFANQQQIASDIRTEATNLLNEIKTLTARNDELTAQIQRSNQQQRPDSLPLGASATTASGDGVNPNGGGDIVLDKFRLQAYYESIDSLLAASTSKTPTSVLVAMKSIVIACKNITEDAELYESSSAADLSPEARNVLEGIKNELSQSLTELMGAAKSHATNYGSVAPGVLENAVDGLTAVVKNLVASLKNAIAGGNGIVGGGIGGSANGGDYEIDDLKDYLERQTDEIVQAIQSLLASMRQNQTFGVEFTDTVTKISTIVNRICDTSSATMAKPSAAGVRTQGTELLGQLKEASSKIGELGSSLVEQPSSKALKQRIASSSYEIAKFVKELISLI